VLKVFLNHKFGLFFISRLSNVKDVASLFKLWSSGLWCGRTVKSPSLQKPQHVV